MAVFAETSSLHSVFREKNPGAEGNRPKSPATQWLPWLLNSQPHSLWATQRTLSVPLSNLLELTKQLLSVVTVLELVVTVLLYLCGKKQSHVLWTWLHRTGL